MALADSIRSTSGGTGSSIHANQGPTKPSKARGSVHQENTRLSKVVSKPISLLNMTHILLSSSAPQAFKHPNKHVQESKRCSHPCQSHEFVSPLRLYSDVFTVFVDDRTSLDSHSSRDSRRQSDSKESQEPQ